MITYYKKKNPFMELCWRQHPDVINLNHNIMETKASIYRSWDDLVFAARNKAYGAYMLRRAYARRLVLAVGMSTTMIAVLLVVPEIVSRFRDEPKIIDEPILEFKHRLTEVQLIRKIEPPKRAHTPVKTVSANAPVLVVSEPVEPSAPEQSTASLTTDDGKPGEGEGFPEGEGTAFTDIPVIVEDKDKVVDFAETPPAYEGGMEAIMKFVKKKLRYPASARRQGIEGTVFVSFVVRGDGSITQVTVLRGIHVECDEEAARVISLLPSWKGGKQNGNPVSVRMVLPLKFSLQ